MDGQIRFEYGNVWTWKLFLNLQRKICEIVGCAELRKRELFVCLFLSRLPHYLRAWNRFYGKLISSTLVC